MSNVHAFRDGAIPNQVNPKVVEELERLLESAQDGLIVGIAYATELVDGGSASGWQRGPNTDTLSTGVMALNYRYAQAISGDVE